MIFNHIIDRFQLKFKDREAAGNILARITEEFNQEGSKEKS
jgi:hypothetical protein